MRVIRFLDENEKICFGCNFENNSATLLEGQLYGELFNTGKNVSVKKLLSPLLPTAILCIGLNYKEHANETGLMLPKYPPLFMKNPSSVTNPLDPIIIPRSCIEKPEVDYEVELAVVIGKAAKNVQAVDATDYILGYTIANDVSARRWQKKAGAGQWVRGKSFDTFCPLGPVLVTTDEISDPQALRLTCSVNQNVLQKSNTSDMIFSIAQLIEFLSEDTTLQQGTVILTGTPGGVGFTRQPPIYLKAGDVVDLTIEKIGTLSNPVE